MILALLLKQSLLRLYPSTKVGQAHPAVAGHRRYVSPERWQAQADYEQQIARAQRNLDQGRKDAQNQLAGMTNTFLWAAAPWDDPAWETYIPTTDASNPSGVRIGLFALEGAQGFPSLPALAPFVGSSSLFITSTQNMVVAAQQLLQTITLCLVVSSLPGTMRLHLANPVSQSSTLTAFMNLTYVARGEAITYRPEDAEIYVSAPILPDSSSVEIMVSKELGNTFLPDQTL